MKQCKIVLEKLILTIVLISILIMFFATPRSYALLEIEDGDFYYAGSTEGSYQATGSNIFSWILKALGDVADFILGMITLAPRMVFVGWTALIEKALTWAVESSAGVTSNGTVVENPTDLTAITDSGGNITVEAIVYNKVAALDADIFNLELDRTISPTGHRLFCDKCETYVDEYGIERYAGKYVTDCCDSSAVNEVLSNPDKYKDTLFKDITIENYSTLNGGAKFCSCECGGKEACYGCSMYFEQLTVEKPTIIIIKENIATWYYIIRMLAMAIMLVVLIFVGIKMAISTIASDKAVYKRMLVDWVVGVIMLFTLHYFMIFVIELNSIVVGLVEENANAVSQASLDQISEDLGTDINKELAYKDLEIRVYEEIRTRAYDAKLSNGVIGMVMYMALVFMAVKYTIIYLKRLLTIMVLTLMAPGVGVAYALQKVISGKSQALKTWMTEYIMNVIIQTVHAIIYAIFISQAMIMSLTNIAGMLVALLFLNYASKAEETFKKIFKFGGKDSLVGHTDTAAQSMKETLSGAINTATGLAVGGKPAARILTNTPYANLLKNIGKRNAAKVYQKLSDGYEKSKEKLYQKDVSEYQKAYEYASEELSAANPDMDVEEKEIATIGLLADMGIIDPRYRKYNKGELTGEEAKKAKAEIDKYKNALEDRVQEQFEELKAKKEKLENGTGRTKKEYDVDKKDEELAQEEFELRKKQKEAFGQLTHISGNDRATKHFDKLLDIENQFSVKNPNGKELSKKEKKESFSKMAYGTTRFDSEQMKFVSNNDSAKDKLFSEQLFGFSEKDKKQFNEHVMPLLKGIVGMGTLFVGMGTIVTEPKAGMALLAAGIGQTGAARKKKYSIKGCKDRYNLPEQNAQKQEKNDKKKKQQKFSFSRFSPKTNLEIAKKAVNKAREEARQIRIDRFMKQRPNFIENLQKGNVQAATLGIAAGLVVSPGITALKAKRTVRTTFLPKDAKIKKDRKSTNNVIQKIKNGANNVGEFTSDMGVYASEKLGFGKAVETANELTVGTFKRSLSKNAHYSALVDYVNGERENFENTFKKEAITLTAEQLKAEQSKLVDKVASNTSKDKIIIEPEGFEFADDKKEVLVRKESISNEDIKANFKPIVEEKGKPSEKVIDEKLNNILQEYSQKSKLDLSSKGIQREIIQKLESDLKAAKLISETQKVGEVFKQGEAGLIKVIKGKAGRMQEEKVAEERMRSTLTPAEQKIVDKSLGKVGKDASPTERMAAIAGVLNNKKDGTQVVSTSDGTRRADASKSGDQIVLFGDQKKTQAVQAYVTAKYAAPKKVSTTNSKKMMAEFLGSALEQFSSDELPTDVSSAEKQKFNSEDVLRDLYSKVKSVSKGTTSQTIRVGEKDYLLNQVQAENATALVRNLLEMAELNKEANAMKLKMDTKGYTAKKKKISSLDIELNQTKIQELQITGNSPEENAKKEKIRKKIKLTEIQKDYVSEQSKIVGMAIDMPKVIEDMRKDIEKKEKLAEQKATRKAGGKK